MGCRGIPQKEAGRGVLGPVTASASASLCPTAGVGFLNFPPHWEEVSTVLPFFILVQLGVPRTGHALGAQEDGLECSPWSHCLAGCPQFWVWALASVPLSAL